MATTVDLGVVRAQGLAAREAQDAARVSLASNQASLATLVSAVSYTAENDAAVAALQASIATDEAAIARLGRRIAALAHLESLQNGGVITIPD